MNEKLSLILSDLKARLQELYGERLEKLILYGSQARGDAEPDSDIDVLVVLTGPIRTGEEIRRISEARAALSLEYEVVISCAFVTSTELALDEEPLLINVRQEGVFL